MHFKSLLICGSPSLAFLSLQDSGFKKNNGRGGRGGSGFSGRPDRSTWETNKNNGEGGGEGGGFKKIGDRKSFGGFDNNQRGGRGGGGRGSGRRSPFRRVRTEDVLVDSRVQDMSFEAKVSAAMDLSPACGCVCVWGAGEDGVGFSERPRRGGHTN